MAVVAFCKKFCRAFCASAPPSFLWKEEKEAFATKENIFFVFRDDVRGSVEEDPGVLIGQRRKEILLGPLCGGSSASASASASAPASTFTLSSPRNCLDMLSEDCLNADDEKRQVQCA